MADIVRPQQPQPTPQMTAPSPMETIGHLRVTEENLLRLMDKLQQQPNVNQRWIALARTHLEQAFMCMTRGIFNPARIKLPGDDVVTE